MIKILHFREVKSQALISIVSKLAEEIWHAHYVSIIGQQQVNYMLKNFQTEQAIAKQIEANTNYFIVERYQQP